MEELCTGPELAGASTWQRIGILCTSLRGVLHRSRPWVSRTRIGKSCRTSWRMLRGNHTRRRESQPGDVDLLIARCTSSRCQLKDRLGDQRGGGSELEPIKILLQRENHAYTPNSQPRIPTQVCQGHVVTADLPTLGTNPKRSQGRRTIKKKRT
jgi:hypothetical protein